ncbi:hypothetical protein [Bacillus paranthracis]|uniref:hypothetical protein n=1 Tax=Bacillus paranthracis TaxID=2026186 RepID=UPI003D658F35
MEIKPMSSKELNEFSKTFAAGLMAGIEKSKRRMNMEFQVGDKILTALGNEATVTKVTDAIGTKMVWFKDKFGLPAWNTPDQLTLLSRKGERGEIQKVVQFFRLSELNGKIVKLEYKESEDGKKKRLWAIEKTTHGKEKAYLIAEK